MAIGVLVDANVLYSRTLRDWLFLIKLRSQGGLYTVHATEDILAEVLYRCRRAKPDAPGRLTKAIHDRIVDSLDGVVSDFVVDGSYPGDDPDDAHVHAAAVACGAEILLTADSGFTRVPEELDLRLPYEVHTPDSFFVLIDDSQPALVETVVGEQFTYWESRPGCRSLGAALRDAGCPLFADRVGEHLQHLGHIGR